MMCLIVDANVVALVFTNTPEPEFEPIQRALFRMKAIAVHGGELTREYLRIRKLVGILKELDRKGVLRKIDDAEVDAKHKALCQEGHCISNDEHIIALALVSDVRLLCSHDQDLHADFTNPLLLKPLGNVYQKRSHRHLIRKHCRKKQP